MTDEYIGFRINSDTKERWQNAADEDPEYRSLTHLISVAVEAELSEDNAAHGAGEAVEVDLSRLHDRFDSVQEQLDDIEDRVEETYILTRDDQSAEIMDIAGEVLNYVPEPDDIESLLSADPGRYDEPERRARLTGQVAAIVELLCADGEYREFEVKQAIERVEREMSTVELRDAEPKAETRDMRILRLPE